VNEPDLFSECGGVTADWRDHWQGMPEFVQEKQVPYAKIIVRVEDEAALRDLMERIGQKLTPKTKSIWHPERERGATCRPFRYVDES